MSYELKGKVIEVFAEMQVTPTVRKREMVVEYADNPQYPQQIKIEAIQDKCNLMDNIRPGDDVEVHFNLNGRKWTDKTGKDNWFNSIQLWKVNVLSAPPAF